MKGLRKIALTIIMIIMTIMIASAFTTTSYATTGSRYLTIKQLRDSGYGYKALEKNIWKICESNSSGTTLNYDHTIYCLKGGPGFGSSIFGSGAPTVRHYTIYFDMKNPSTIEEEYASAIPSTSSDTYKSLLWLLENVYVAPKTNATDTERATAAEYRELLLEKAGIAGGYITDDDIDAVQQLAVWHFTNNDEYKVENSSSEGTFEFWVNAVANSDGNYNALSDAIGNGATNGWDRAEECQALYNYLVGTAENMASNYTVTTASQPYELDDDLTITQKTEGNNYIIGPFKINKISNTAGTLAGTFKNGNTTITPTMQDVNGNPFNTLQDTVGKEFYIVLPTSTTIENINLTISGSYFDTTITYWSVDKDEQDNDQPVVEVERTKEPYTDTVTFTPQKPEKKFDLALRKFISSVNGTEPNPSREPQISQETLQDLADGNITTTVKTHPKTPIEVKTGDKVIYTIRVYNEGEVDGYVKQITDYLPEGLKLAENSTINTNNGWTNPSGDGKTIVTDKLAGTKIAAFNKDTRDLQYLDVQVECEVIATVQNTDNVLKNIAEITAHSDSTGDVTVKDDDSDPHNVDKDNYGTTNQEDDDDFEQLIIFGQYFDLSLRKFITAIGDKELVDENGKYTRAPEVNVTPLLNGEKTATYEHNKKPVNVDVGDIVTYTIRVYNEGEIDGYVHEITDHLPEYLEFVNDEFNASYGWKVSSDGRTVTTNIISPDTEYSASRDTLYANRTEDDDKVLLKAFNTETKELDYIDVKIRCKVKDTGIAEKITNIAEITRQTDSNGNTVIDRDSVPSNVTLPTDEVLPNYKDDEIERGDEYIPGQQDDDDFEKVIVQKFDLALRKFITGVNDQEVAGRVPSFSMDSEGNMTYIHPKTPVEVVNGDIVIYTLRVYNEGNQSGYADEVKDDIPEGLVYLPDNELNKTYRWKMYKADGTETADVSEAKTIRTDYLSKAQEDETGRDNLMEAFNKNTMTQPDFKDIKVAFKVTEPNTSDRILINTAEITKDSDEKGVPVEDIDSTPDNDKDGEDDIDIEKVKVKYFDLALEKIISEYSITLNGKTTVTKTGHKFGVQPEPVVKIETLKNTRKNATIKFKYQIQVTNEGEIAGYATEIKDYIPTGLKFVQADNPKWKLSEDGKTVTTDQLKDTLLQPEESAVVEITFQWINGEDNLGLKQNWAEISKDKNDSDSPDIDSTPDNNKKGEDDIDDASVILSVVTGIGENYILIGGAVLAILTGGIILIKKFVI